MDVSSPFIMHFDDIDLLKRFTRYIEQVIVCARIDYYRRQDRQKEVLLDELLSDSEQTENDSFQLSKNVFDFEIEQHKNAFNRLSSLRRRILTLIFIDGLSGQQIAERLSLTVEYVYLQKHRALKALRKQLIYKKEELHGE